MAPPLKSEAQKIDPKWASSHKDKRFEEALRRVANGVPIATAARNLSVSRSQLNVRLNEERAKAASNAERSQAVSDAKASSDGSKAIVTVSNEKRRVPGFDEFNEMYFNGLICPDCGVHHQTPAFHQEIVDAVYGPDLRVLINVPPYHSKSTLVTVKTTIHSLVENPNGRHIIVSASQPFARTFMHSMKQWFVNPELYANSTRNLIEDWGPFEGPGWTTTQAYMAGRSSSEKDPSILAIGVGNQIYGRRADRIIFDDIATLDNQRNPEQVTKTLEWIDKEALSRIGKTGKAIWAGTRISSGDIYSHLQQRDRYRVVKYPCIIDEEGQQTLWEDHFPFQMASLRRGEMRPEDWQLVYQNVDTPGAGSSFPPEVLETCLDTTMVHGQVNPAWKLVIGLDPAGGGKQSGFTAMVLLGLDRQENHIHVVDIVNVRSMKAFQMKDQILDWCNTYPVQELRTEVNGIQGQLIQYNQDLIVPLTNKGVRVVPHYCVDMSTEVMSQRGWLKGDEVAPGDQILTLNTSTNASEWKPVRDVYRGHYEGPMVNVESRTLSALVTPDHSWPVTSQNHPDDLAMKKTVDLNSSDHIPLGRASTWDPEPVWADDFVELVGWAATEGHFRSRNKAICIGQSESANPEKVARLHNLLDRMDASYATSRHSVAPAFSHMVVFELSGQLALDVRAVTGGMKTIPSDFIVSLSKQQRQLLIDTLVITDGWTQDGHLRFCSNDKGLVEAFEMLSALEGMSTGSHTRQFEGIDHPHFTTGQRQSRNAYWVNQKPTTIEWAGDIWCPQTENGTFYARRNGKTFFTGNTTGNKWDANFGVEAIAPWFYNQKVSIPWGSQPTQHKMREMMDQFIGFPMAERSDLVMAFWFAWLGCKAQTEVGQGPMYGARRVPQYVRQRRRVADLATGALWRPNDANMPDFGRYDQGVEGPRRRELVNVAKGVDVY